MTEQPKEKFNRMALELGEEVICMTAYCMDQFEPVQGLEASEQFCKACRIDSEQTEQSREQDYHQIIS